MPKTAHDKVAFLLRWYHFVVKMKDIHFYRYKYVIFIISLTSKSVPTILHTFKIHQWTTENFQQKSKDHQE